MSGFAARIGRVRMKDGATVHVLPQPNMPIEDEEDYRAALVRNARAVAEQGTDDDPLVGYVLIGIYDSGMTSVDFRYFTGNANAIPRSLIPAWIEEICRRELITSIEAEERFDTMFKWQDGQ